MKKRKWKICGIIGMVLALTLSNTAIAQEVILTPGTDSGKEVVLGTEAETEKQQDNGLEALLFTMTSKKTETMGVHTSSTTAGLTTGAAAVGKEKTVVQVTEEDLESLKEKKELPETTVIVFQKKADDAEDETLPESETGHAPKEFAMDEETESSTTQTEKKVETETTVQKQAKTAEMVQEELPKIELTQDQITQVETIARMMQRTIVVTNGCTLEDELMFQNVTQVNAVLSLNEKDGEALTKALEKLDVSVSIKDYQKKMQAAKEQKSTEQTSTNKTGKSTGSESSTTQSTLAPRSTVSPGGLSLSGSAPQTNKQTNGQTNKQTNGQSGSEEESQSNTTSLNQTVGTKDVTFTLVPDELLEGEDVLSATYEIKCEKEITECQVTITFDKDKMSLESASYSDALEDLYDKNSDYIKEPDANGTDAKEGRVVFSFKSDTPTKFDGGLVDVWFKLKEAVKKGDTHSLKLTVDTLKNGSSDVTYTIKETKQFTAVGVDDEDGDEDESQSQSQSQSNSNTNSTSDNNNKTNTAAKTGDETNLAMWFAVMAAAIAAGAYGVYGKKRKRI